MEQQKKCPACGEILAPGTARCPNCQLEGLDQIFLSRADYDNWVCKVLKPHMGRLSLRVFSNGGTLLFLTGDGELYGMGENHSGQIAEDGPDCIGEPVHLASNVISAGVSYKYTVFATEDGRIHIRGRGEFADRVPEFCDAREVFVDGSQFFVVNRQGQVFAFGDNYDGSLEPEKGKILKAFPKATSVQYDFYDPRGYSSRLPSDSDRQFAEREVREKVLETEAYQAFAQRYEPSNLHILLELTSTERRDHYYSRGDFDQIYRFIPTLVWQNTYLYTPVLYHDQDYANTPHRYGSAPLDSSHRHELDAHPQIKKACGFYHRGWAYLAVCHDGSLVWFDHKETLHRLNWTKAPIQDLAGFHRAVASCKDGRLYLLDTTKLPEIEIIKEITL